MTEDREQRIQERAYSIWEAEGCPHGREREHWEQAEREFKAGQASLAVDSSSAPSPVKKPAKPMTKKPAATTRRGKNKKKTAELRP